MLTKRFLTSLGCFLAAAAVPVVVNGCTSSLGEDLCCTEFKSGGTIDAKISGSAQGQVLAQATADFTGVAAGAVDDVLTACRNIAQDLDAPAAEQTTAEGKATPREKMAAWCDLAVRVLTNVKGSASITATFEAPKCEASISAKANCQAKCSVDGKCDIKANPPKCEGGKLEVACKGECSVTATQPKITCEGKCEASCTGSCSASATAPSVTCKGKCNGTCKGAAQGGTGTGIQADGSCDGQCEGSCELKGGADVKCEGSCKGECTGSCKAEGGVSAKCSGECKADFEPIKCTGGELKGGCTVDAKCDANCDASVKAKAECSPPKVAIKVSGGTNADKIIATLEANLPLIIGVKERAKVIGNLGGTISGNLSAAGDIKVACIPLMVDSVKNAADDIAATGSATASFSGSVGGT